MNQTPSPVGQPLKKIYVKPALKKYGSFADLTRKVTQSGLTDNSPGQGNNPKFTNP